MTYEEREAMFAKECLTTKDIAKLYECSLSEASEKIGEIKRRTGDRLGVKGRVHIEDYLEHYKITNRERYVKRLIREADTPATPKTNADDSRSVFGTVCIGRDR